jgi:hypothetical protein
MSADIVDIADIVPTDMVVTTVALSLPAEVAEAAPIQTALPTTLRVASPVAATTTPTTCPICCETCTKSKNVAVSCNYCAYMACRTCVQQYLLTQYTDPHCMNPDCKRAWNREFIDANLTLTFRSGEWKRHREHVLLDRARSQLPAAQTVAEPRIAARRTYQLWSYWKTEFMRRQSAYNRCWHSHQSTEPRGYRVRAPPNRCINCKAMRHGVREARQLRDRYRAEYLKARTDEDTAVEQTKRPADRRPRNNDDASDSDASDASDASTANSDTDDDVIVIDDDAPIARPRQVAHAEAARTSKKTGSSFVRACPNGDCRGFLNDKWVCGLCSATVCSKCHEVKTGDCAVASAAGKAGRVGTTGTATSTAGGSTATQEHVCDPALLATAQLIRSDSKPCPSCHAMIFRVSGCLQMFCTQCHTAFEWNTGEVVTNGIHNPHYYEWLQQQRDQGQDVGRVGFNPFGVCDGEQDIQTVWQQMSYVLRHHGNEAMRSQLSTASTVVHRVQHLRLVAVNDLGRKLENRDDLELAVRYLTKDIDESGWRCLLQRNEKARERLRDVRMIFDMAVTVATDIFRQTLATAREHRLTPDETAAMVRGTVPPQHVTFARELCARLEELRKYVNECLMRVHRRYANKVPLLNERWYLTDTKRQAAADRQARQARGEIIDEKRAGTKRRRAE